jgi:hypothetical protein
MSLATTPGLDVASPPRPALAATRPAVPRRFGRLFLVIGWIFLAAAFCVYAWRIVRIGVDLRNGFWVYWTPNHFYGDLDNAYAQGNLVLGRARFLARQHGQPWLDQRTPGLFDPPLDWSNFVARWQRLRPVYAQIIRGWVDSYDHLEQTISSGNYDLDYPPLRLLTITLWTWHAQSRYPGLESFPDKPVTLSDRGRKLQATSDIAAPLLQINLWADGISALAMFALVWIWVRRGEAPAPMAGPGGWRTRFGDPILLAPLVLMGIFLLLYRWLTWQLELPDNARAGVFNLDQHVSAVGFWAWWIVRFLTVVCLARFLPPPFRAPACGLVAATLVWLNPALILIGFGWPQWDGWVLPFFLIAAVLASINWWLLAGVMLGVGCMFKGQLLLIAPVLLLCPLFAGWPGRFFRIIAGWTAAAAIVLWPWLITNHTARAYVIGAVTAAAGLICIASLARRPVFDSLRRLRRRPPTAGNIRPILWLTLVAVAVLAAVAMTLWICGGHSSWLNGFALLLCAAVVLAPWRLPRRMIGPWLLAVFAAATWLGAFMLDGSFSWFDVGFAYGTRKFQEMQISPNSLSNLAGILQEKRFAWHIHDRVTTWQFPWWDAPTDLDIRQVLAIIYFIALLACAIGAAIQLRRGSTHFLIALAAPAVLFVTLLTQMSVRYTILAAALSAALVGVSVGMSLFQLLLTVLSCVMVGTRLLDQSSNLAPRSLSIFHDTQPDLGYAMLLIAAVFLYGALVPGRRGRRAGDL